MSNTFGKAFRLTTFGESHGQAVGGIIDGCPSNIPIDISIVQHELARRRPGQSALTTPRNEADEVVFLSGIFQGKTTGAPIAFEVRNHNQRSSDYDHLKDVYRPSHADFVYHQKYKHFDYRGGGRSSARETIARVAAGAIAKQVLAFYTNVKIRAYTSGVGEIFMPQHALLDFSITENNPVRCPNAEMAKKMEQYIDKIRNQNDSVGGVVTCHILNMPVGVGQPVFGKLNAELGYAMLGINAVKGFEIGAGFAAAEMLGSEHNDEFYTDENGQVHTKTNFSGGTQGGISNGQPIEFRVAFKPVATIGKAQNTINKQGQAIKLEAKGRHDPCVVPRAVPIVEAMAALTVLDLMLQDAPLFYSIKQQAV